jgi:perosamine synthetase
MNILGARVLITGGAGFIGSELTRQLAEGADEVVVVDNLVNGRRENLRGLPDRVRLFEVDIRDTIRLQSLLAGIDVVFHLACLGVRHSIHSPRENHDVNATATLELLSGARSARVSRFVYVSSSEVYGTATRAPMDEDHPTYPKTVYGSSKLAGECYTRAYHDTYGFPTVVVRPFNTYGPRCHHEGDSGEVIPKFMLRAMTGRPMLIFGDGLQTRDFTYVSDTARGILQVGTSDAAVGQTVNLGSGCELQIRELTQEIGQVLGVRASVEHVEDRPGDVRRLYADPGKAQRLCEYRAAIPFGEGLAKLRDWYRSLGVPPEKLLEEETVRNWEPAAPETSDARLIVVAKPMLGRPEAEAATRAILSGWVTQGPEVAGFERDFREYVGSPYACAVSNCTTALHLALKTVGVGPDHEVVTVSHSFVATANSIRYCGAKPVFVDIDPATLNMNPALIESAISSRTRAILCVHQIGLPCDITAILAVARKHGLPVIEDAACAIGSEILVNRGWERVGRPHGDIACFSFHPRKLLTTGDGGMLTTANGDWDRQFRLLRQHGMGVSDAVRHSSREVTFETYSQLGYNYRMTDIQAAVGREQLKRLPDAVGERRRLALRYRDLLSGDRRLRLPVEGAAVRTNWQSYCVRLPDETPLKHLMQALLDQGIATRRGIMCAHREPAYAAANWRCWARDCAGGPACNHLGESEKAQDHSILLPFFNSMTAAEQETVAAALVNALASRS